MLFNLSYMFYTFYTDFFENRGVNTSSPGFVVLGYVINPRITYAKNNVCVGPGICVWGESVSDQISASGQISLLDEISVLLRQ